MSLATVCPSSSSTSLIITLAPSAAKRRAWDSPMPRAPPEISATLPASRLATREVDHDPALAVDLGVELLKCPAILGVLLTVAVDERVALALDEAAVADRGAERHPSGVRVIAEVIH